MQEDLSTAMSISVIQAAQVTVAYSGLYGMTLFTQFVKKKLIHAKKIKEGKVFDRYNSIEMRPYDRLTMNYLEWMPVFLCPLWSMAATDTLTDTSITVAWVYISLRTMYFGLVLKFGVNISGHNAPLWISTFPGYGCLIYLLFRAATSVF